MIKYVLLTIVVFSAAIVRAQQDLRLGEWRSHLPNNQGWSVTQSPNNIVYGTPWSLIFIDKEELTPTFLSKEDGLSDIGVADVTYDRFNDQLFVAYSNSNVDIIDADGVIINIPNILANTSISGDRQINDIHIASSDVAYIAAGFGVISLDPASLNFGFTAITGVKVNQVATSGKYVYAATDDGVYRISSSTVNKADFSTWELLDQAHGLPVVYEARGVVLHNNRLYIGTEDAVYESTDESDWLSLYQDPMMDLQYLQESDDRLLSGWTGVDFRGETRFFDAEGDFITSGGACTNLVREGIRDDQGRIWYAEGFNGIRWSSDYTSGCSIVSYEGPYSHLSSDIVSDDSLVLVASGGVSESFGFLFKREGMYLRQDRTWTNLNEFEDERLKNIEALSIFRVAIHPSEPIIYGGSYWAGLLAYDRQANTYQLYNQSNSTLRGSAGDPLRERVTGLAFDEEESLWVTTYNAAAPLNVLSVEDEWESFSVISPGTLSDIVIDELGYKWCPVFGNSGGVLVFKSPAEQRFITTNNSDLPSNLVNAIAVDRDGAVWVGTSEGPIVYDCGSEALDNNCIGLRPQVIQDGIPAVLLADQDVRVIAVDGADNKWFGTRNGIFVQSPNGEDQIAVFSADNSPLYDNEITALNFQEATGTMYIGSNKGIQAYQTATSVGGDRHRESDVYAFPNPVGPDYFGTIAIKGLVDNAMVKVTDVDGKLVTEMRSMGGTATWDGKDLQGRQVSAGVYLVWSTSTPLFDAPDAYVTKIMIAR